MAAYTGINILALLLKLVLQFCVLPRGRRNGGVAQIIRRRSEVHTEKAHPPLGHHRRTNLLGRASPRCAPSKESGRPPMFFPRWTSPGWLRDPFTDHGSCAHRLPCIVEPGAACWQTTFSLEPLRSCVLRSPTGVLDKRSCFYVYHLGIKMVPECSKSLSQRFQNDFKWIIKKLICSFFLSFFAWKNRPSHGGK